MSSPARAKERATTSRTYHGGPEERLRISERSKRLRGLKPTYAPNASHSEVIVRSGEILSKKRYAKIVDEILASRAKLDAYQELSPGFRKQAQRPERERPGSGGTLTNINRPCLRDPDAGEHDHGDERALSRAIGASSAQF
jgi:hypothetical protein